MSTNFYHTLAIAGWIINLISHLMLGNSGPSSLVQGLGSGIILISYLTIILKNRQQKNEATSR